MDTFRSCDLKLQTVAVLWTLFGVVEIPSQNCKPWQFYGHFSEFSKSVHTTANVGSSMDTSSKFFSEVLKLQTLAVLWTLFGLKYYGV